MYEGFNSNSMKTKLEIIQKLLDERAITAQEAMTLMEKEKEFIYVPSHPVSAPYNPYPWWYSINSDYVTGQTSTEITISSN